MNTGNEPGCCLGYWILGRSSGLLMTCHRYFIYSELIYKDSE